MEFSRFRIAVSSVSLAALGAVAVMAAGCPGGGPGDIVFDECLEVMNIGDGVLRVTEPDSGESSSSEPVGQVTQPLNVKIGSVWRGVTRIPVCWETWDTDSESVTMREDVRIAVRDTWEAALADPRIPADEHVKFTGWDRCDGDNDGIRIVVEDVGPDDGPHVKELGDGLKNRRKGMSLDFTFKNWSPSCGSTLADRRWCNKK